MRRGRGRPRDGRGLRGHPAVPGAAPGWHKILGSPVSYSTLRSAATIASTLWAGGTPRRLSAERHACGLGTRKRGAAGTRQYYQGQGQAEEQLSQRGQSCFAPAHAFLAAAAFRGAGFQTGNVPVSPGYSFAQAPFVRSTRGIWTAQPGEHGKHSMVV